MKIKLIASTFFLLIIGSHLSGQEGNYPEKHGSTLNVGLGISHFGYLGYSTPAIHFNYEFDVVRNFTLAPFVSLYSYRRSYNIKGDRYYARHTVVPVGGKASYYFDELFNAGSKWDFYLAGSLGFAIVTSRYDNEYDKDYYRGPNPLYLDIHIGAEYHINNRIGAFLDLSSGMSTIGLAIHSNK